VKTVTVSFDTTVGKMTEMPRQKNMQQQSISIGNRFHVTPRIVCPTIWKQCFRVKRRKAEIKVVKAKQTQDCNESIDTQATTITSAFLK